MRTFVCMLLFFLGAGCQKDMETSDDVSPSDTTAPKAKLPQLKLTEETADLLLTWIDEHGDFHVTSKIQAVPEKARDQVRVVVTTQPEGTAELLYIADLRKKQSDGSYAVKTLPRSAWEELGAKKRKQRMEALAASASPPKSMPSAGSPAASRTQQPGAQQSGKVGAGIVAIVYGAEWCGPCHKAKSYLEGRGTTVIYKDIEKNPQARREMQAKLLKNGNSGAAIPIIDVAGRLLVGYSPSALDQALKAAKTAKK